MAQNLTPILAVASAGLLDNKGLAPSANLLLSVSSFNNNSITSLAQQCLDLGDANLSVAVGSVSNFLTGIVPQNLQTIVPENIQEEFDFDNLIDDIKQQVDRIMTNGVPGLVTTLSRVQSSCVAAYDLRGTYQQMSSGSFDDFGVTIGSYSDVLTGGVNSQFSNFVGGINNSSVREMITQLGNFGTMYDITKLDSLDNPVVLCKNLINQGFFLINEILTNNNINTSNIDSVDSKKLLSVLSSITGVELQAIVAVTEFKSARELENLSQVLDAKMVFTSNALVAAGGSMAALSNKLVNIGGKFRSFKDLSSTLLSIKLQPSPNLTGLGSLGNNQLFNNSRASIPSGNGFFGNPTIYDIIGVLVGDQYTEKILRLTQIHDLILANPLGQNIEAALSGALESEDYSLSASQINLAAAALKNTNNQTILNLINEGNLLFNEIFDLILKERKNSKLSQIVFSDSIGSHDSVSSFVLDLHSAWNDQRELKYSEFVKKLVTNDIFGEAIVLAIDEGYNLAVLSNKNVPAYTQIDPIGYSSVVKSQPVC